MFPAAVASDDASLAVSFAHLSLPNPVGIAAGFDKDARVPDAILRLGCGFAEIGTVTPLPQLGNPSPRVFRLPRDRAVINRLGFNNGGHAAALARLQRRTGPGVVGVNIGANKDATDRVADYVRGLETFYDVASYFTINISSPNTPGLRDLQDPAALEELLQRLLSARAKQIGCRQAEAADCRETRARHRRTRSRRHRHATCRAGRRRHRRLQHDALTPRVERRQRAPGRRPVWAPAVPSLHSYARARISGDGRHKFH